MVAALAACGGGGDDSAAGGGGGGDVGAVVPPPVIVPTGVTVATIATPSAAPGDSDGFETSGPLKVLAFAANGTTTQPTATVTFTPPNNGTLAFGTATATTTNGWSSVVWSGAGVTGGNLFFDGNAAIACSGNQFGDGEVFISANMTPVSSSTPLIGSTFDGVDCETNYTIVYNSNGTLTTTYAGQVEVINAANTAALFSTGGLTDPDTSNFKARVYSINFNGQVRHAIVIIGQDCVSVGNCTPAVELLIQRP